MSSSPKLFHLPFRSRNKEPANCNPYPSSFDEYIESDLFESSDNTVGTASSDDSSNLFDFATSCGASYVADLSVDARHADAEEPAPALQGSLKRLDRRAPASPHTETSSGADKAGAVLESDHITLEDFSYTAAASSPTSRVALSPPPSPTPELSITKKRFALPIRASTGTKSPIRKLQRLCSQSPPKMMSPRHQRVGTFHGAWATRLEAASEKFNLHIPSQSSISPSPSATRQQTPRARTFVPSDFRGFDAAPLVRPNLDEPLSPTSQSHAMHNPYLPQSHAVLTPLTSPTFPQQSPALNPSMQDQAQPLTFNPGHLQSNHEANATLLHTPPPSQKLQNGAWNPESQDYLDYAYSATSPTSTNHKAEAWWNPASVMHGGPQYSNCSANPTLIGLGLEGVAAPHLGSEQLLGQYDLSTGGFDSLMQTSAHGLPNLADAAFTSPTLLSPVPALMPSTPITPSTTYLHSRNSSASPTPLTPSSRHVRAGGASRAGGRQHHRCSSQSQHHRRRPSSSAGRGGDLSSSSSAVVSSTTGTTSGKSRELVGGAGGAQGGAGNANGSSNNRSIGGGVGFVNFTPDDSRKILTGVAPSGSSKTKARREKEAQEKRRKLSEAARRAVVEAGGDIARLEREGLLAGIMAAES